MTTDGKSSPTRTETRWGYYDVLWENEDFKLKLLCIRPGCGISYQRHRERVEDWHVVEGHPSIAVHEAGPPDTVYTGVPGMRIRVYSGVWHQVWNHGSLDVKIVELQSATSEGLCREDDIERIQYGWIEHEDQDSVQ